MVGRQDTVDDGPNGGSASGRLLMVFVIVLAVSSTLMLVLADNTTWLRMGVLAALWAALLAGLLAVRFRKQVGDRENEVADLQSVYELELEREVAARREYELEVEAEARKRVEEASRADLAELRTELRGLRESLERLNGGEVLVERFALRAQSTRMRALAEGQPRVVPSDSRRGMPAVAGPTRQLEPATELMARPGGSVPGMAPVRRDVNQRPGGYRPEPRRPQSPRAGAVTSGQDDRREVPAVASLGGQPPPRPGGQQDGRPGQPDGRPGWPDGRQQPQAPVRMPVQRPVRAQAPQVRPQPPQSAQSPPPSPPQPRPGPSRPPAEAGWPAPSAAEVSRPGVPRAEPPRPTHAAPPAERTRRAEPARHADTGQQPKDWQEYREWRAREDTGWNTDPETSGAHTAGRSVTELLAAHGGQEAPSRHRRRAD